MYSMSRGFNLFNLHCMIYSKGVSVEELKAKAKENLKQAQNAVKSSAEAPKAKPTATTSTTTTTTAKPKAAASPEAVAARSKMPYESSAPVRSFFIVAWEKRTVMLILMWYRLWIRSSSWIFWKRRMLRQWPRFGPSTTLTRIVSLLSSPRKHTILFKSEANSTHW